ncbi:FxsA family protein [Dethiobacter alkaliphilus]|uniref:FxsA cytoplasmic membrane protein n=1 Tax=Dethiobacter alkaliphilus AHT 1 TaxID=555088 RepID=C0GHD5_DETAL|nr:FxsA family protein [Dethiobacter alkaliphilus]EEG77141.1 FxsA cytoplasmic membrane protein [Dethiobacter alkaliphilus AHT 1]
MFAKLLLLFTLGPLIELYLLIELGKRVGTAPTIILVLATGFFGVFLAKAQGFLVLRRISEALRFGQLPADELLDGVLVLVGAAFLLTPGLISDTAGFLFLIPGTRKSIKAVIRRKLKKALEDGSLQIFWR